MCPFRHPRSEPVRKLSGKLPGAEGHVAVSASIGFETFNGSDLDSVHTLRRNAERALRTAKLRGGDRGVYYRLLSQAGARDDDEDAGEEKQAGP